LYRLKISAPWQFATGRLVSQNEAAGLLGFMDGLRPSLDEAVPKYKMQPLCPKVLPPSSKGLGIWPQHLLRYWYSPGFLP